MKVRYIHRVLLLADGSKNLIWLVLLATVRCDSCGLSPALPRF